MKLINKFHTNDTMFNRLSPELVALVESFHEVPYWKGRFSEGVLPHLNKGWRLVGIAHDGDFCFGCLRKNCEFEFDHPDHDWISDEETFELLNQEPVIVLNSAARVVFGNLARAKQQADEEANYYDYSDEEEGYEVYSDEVYSNEESSDEED